MSRALTNRNIAIGLGAILVVVVVVVAITRGLGDEGVPSGDVAVVDADVNAEAAGISDGKISQDDHHKSSARVQELTDKLIKEIDDTLASKEAEIHKV